MKVVIIDGQGGRIGQSLVEKIKEAKLSCDITAIGTNSAATAAMLKAGADRGATGENPVLVACRDADVIMGPLGIIAADSLMGEITADMAAAVARSSAMKVLLPVNMCNKIVAGTRSMTMSALIQEAVTQLQEMITA